MDQEQFDRAAQLAGSLESIIGLVAALVTLIGGLIWLRQLTGKAFPFFAILFVIRVIGVAGVIIYFASRASDAPNPPPTTQPEPKPEPEPEPEPEEPRPTIPLADQLAAVARDLASPDRDPQNHRYLTLTHLHNDPTVTNDQLREARKATEDLAEYLSPPGVAATFRPIDEQRTIYRIDFEELNRGTPLEIWPAVLAKNPYGLEFEQADDEKLRRADAEIQKLTGSREPWYARGDWFVFTATRPPLGGPTGPLGVSGGELPDSVRTVAGRYPRRNVGLDTAAAELGLSDASLIKQKLLADKGLRDRFGLASLTDGRTVTRDQWESRENGLSPFQQLAFELLGASASNPLP